LIKSFVIFLTGYNNL